MCCLGLCFGFLFLMGLGFDFSIFWVDFSWVWVGFDFSILWLISHGFGRLAWF